MSEQLVTGQGHQANLMPRRPRHERTTEDYFAGIRRMIRAAGRRAAEDENGLTFLVEMKEELEKAIRLAVAASREDGYSWAEIARVLGVKPQSAWERYGKEG